VVLETIFSGISEIPFAQFVLLMQPIHLAIGIVEGAATAAVILFIWQARPEILQSAISATPPKRISIKPVLAGLIAATVLTGGVLSWFASAHPDGLEWAMFKVSGKEELETPEHSIYSSLATLQEKTAVLPDYTFKKTDAQTEEEDQPWPAVDQGTSFSGLIGGAIVFLIAMGIGFGLRKKKTTP
jgi:cobalt/nickel transport system permease protein